MATINPNSLIGRYKKPGIYISEIDMSARPRQIAQDGVITLIVGVSKKGPANRPVFIQSQQQFISIFGDIDRHLEYKGSYFHRTCLNMLRSGPIIALNLLLTDPDRDKVEYVNLSCSSGFFNESVKQMPFEDPFLKNDFWNRDADSLIYSADKDNPDPKNLLTFTNFSDKKITIWVFKSSLKGYDIPAIQWYGNEDALPSFVNKNSLISDYLVKVLAVQGDFTNYKELSLDPIWSKYFNRNGLIPSKVNELIFSEPNITILGNYDVSLIPFFRDTRGRDMYIENIINADTDRTGLFCGYRAELLQGYVDKGLIDIVGNWIAYYSLNPSNEFKRVNFLSYDEQLTEDIEYDNVFLDKPGNTWGWQNFSDPTKPSRHAKYGNGFIEGLSFDNSSSSYTNTTGTFEFSFTPDAYCVYNREKKNLDTTQTSIDIPNISSTVVKPTYRTDLVVINELGSISIVKGNEITTTSLSSASDAVDHTLGIYPGAPRLLNNDIVIGVVRVERDIDTSTTIPTVSSTTNYTYYPIAIDEDGWIAPEVIIDNGSSTADNMLNIVFLHTQGTLGPQHVKGLRNMVFFNDFRNLINTNTSIILDSNSNKIYLSDCTITINAALMSLKTITIVAPDDVNILNSSSNTLISSGPNRKLNWVTLYRMDDEFLLGTHSMKTKKEYITNVSSSYTFATEGVVGKNSIFYTDFINGKINSGDFTKPLLFDGLINFAHVSGKFIIDLKNYTDSFGIFAPTNKIFISGLETESPSLNKLYTITNSYQITSPYSALRIEVLENVVVQNNVKAKVLGETIGKYIKCYTVNGILRVEFTPEDLSGPDPITVPSLSNIVITSGKSNFKQTLEIENIIESNKVAISADRYPEVQIGDYIQALVDYDNVDITSGEFPRHITRIIDKVRNPADTTQFIITTDAPIYVLNAGDSNSIIDYQTYFYKSFENYVTGYKGIALKGFKVNKDSLPDGTEERQSKILSMIGKGTPLFYALSDRNKIKWRYLVDSFGLGLTSNSKQELVDLCGQKVNCLGFINTPSAMKSFKNSTSPSFLNKNGTLNYEWIAKGGNPNANNAFRYTLADGPGRSSVSYWHPWVIVNDNGAPLPVPPASFVANTYMQKFISRSGNIFSHTVMAGVVRGIVNNITDLEIQLQDRDVTELLNVGINTITYKMDRDFSIDSELTAQVIPNTALSLIHTRELLIDIENELYNMLHEYQWEFNTPEIRQEIQDRADAICQKYLERDGLYAYQNIMDESNNTEETIDAQMGILFTYLEVTKAMGILTNQIFIMKTGDLKSSGFS